MKLQLVNGIAKIVDPQIVDLSVSNTIQVEIEGFTSVELGSKCYEFKENIANVRVSKGTHIMILIKYNKEGKLERTVLCEPILVFDINDQLKAKQAVYIDEKDLANRVNTLESQIVLEQDKVTTLQAELKIAKDKLNEIIPVLNNLSTRISDMEKNYDPTQI